MRERLDCLASAMMTLLSHIEDFDCKFNEQFIDAAHRELDLSLRFLAENETE